QDNTTSSHILEDLKVNRGYAWQSRSRSSQKMNIDQLGANRHRQNVTFFVSAKPICRRAGARQPGSAALGAESVLCRQGSCCTIVGIISVGMMPLTGSRLTLPMDTPVLSGLARRIVQEELLDVQTAGR